MQSSQRGILGQNLERVTLLFSRGKVDQLVAALIIVGILCNALTKYKNVFFGREIMQRLEELVCLLSVLSSLSNGL